MIKLRPNQRLCVDAFYRYYEAGKTGHPLIVVPTAGGKSIIIGQLATEILQKWPSQRILILSHVKELIIQNHSKIMQIWPNAPAGIYSAGVGKRQPQHPIVVASLQSVVNKAAFLGHRDLLFIDECFAGETLIETLKGEKRIDEVRLGDVVYNATGCGVVTAISKKSSNILYKVSLSNGRKIRVTGNHPFLSTSGWKNAKDLAIGTQLLGLQNMPELWKQISSGESEKLCSASRDVSQSSFLLDLLLKEDGECNVGAGCKRENAKNIKRDRSQAIDAWWEWQRINIISKKSSRNIGKRLDCGATDKNGGSKEFEDLSNMLQSRFGEQSEKNCNRVGREYAYREANNFGRKKRQFSHIIRVENIEVEESRGGENIYNLQVDGHPSYFSNGVLVHNCHLIQPGNMGMYGKLIKDLLAINPCMKICGFTATPYRMDSGLLTEGDDALFSDIIIEITIEELLQDGYLTPPIGKDMLVQADMTGVKVIAGEYSQREMGERFDAEEFLNAALDSDMEYLRDRRSIAFFCVTVENARHVAEGMTARGIPTEVIDGEMSAAERDNKFARFRSGELRGLASVGVMTTGTDIPCIDCLVLLFATKSPGKYQQVIGRGFRVVYADGYDIETREGRLAAIKNGPKKNFLVLDHGANIAQHGPITHVRRPMKKKPGEKVKREKTQVRICECCRTAWPLETTVCGVCGTLMKVERDATANLEVHAGTEDIMGTPFSRGEVAQWFDVENVHYARHVKAGNPDSFRVTYDCGLVEFREWVHFERTGFLRSKAEKWWGLRTHLALPVNVEMALAGARELKKPLSILVKKKDNFFEILQYNFNQQLDLATA